MRKNIIMIKVLLQIVFLLVTTVPASAGWFDVYVYGEYGMSTLEVDTDGINTLTIPPIAVLDSEAKDLDSLALKAGIAAESWRLDLGITDYPKTKFKTASYTQPDASYFFDSSLKTNSLMAAAYYDLFKFSIYPSFDLRFFLGIGGGISRLDLKVNDQIAEGREVDLNLAWQWEVGTELSLTDVLRFDLGYRCTNLGKTEANLHEISNSNPAGNYSMDVKTQEVFIGLRFFFMSII